MTDSTVPCLEVAADSNIGLVRGNNEDRYAVVTLQCAGRPSTLALVADGVGGHAAGEVASQIVVEAVVRQLTANPCEDPARALPRAVIQAGREVAAKARSDQTLRGMGTTIAAAWLVDGRLYTTTVGDSRIYLRREGRVLQASVDHTWVQEAVERGLLTPDQAKNHPNAHVLRRHLGGEKDPEPDQRLRLVPGEEDAFSIAHQGLPLEEGDAVVLCSDGLSDLVTGEEIGRALQRANPEQVVRELIDLARERGGHDNITVVVLRMPGKRGSRLSPRIVFLFAAGILLFLILAGAVTLVLFLPPGSGLR